MNRGDRLVERGADKLQQLSDSMAARGGPAARLAADIQDDAVFLRKLKPSLVKARARGGGPPGGRVEDGEPKTEVNAPAGPQLRRRPKSPGSGPNPFAVVGAALFVGIVLAKVIDWRGHAHPR
ncbi:MAG: hypothetical protein H0U90_09535 [Actinobacteria bacterium]|nr:hypothetical protein [Actinomycetota bacterium]